MSYMVTIEKLDVHGKGIGYLNNKIIFIPNALPSEILEVEIEKEKKKFLEGKVIKYIKKSNNRVIPKCPYYSLCGGCDLEHLTYHDTIIFKEKMLQDLFLKQLSYKNKILVQEAKNPWFYRNKLHLKVRNGQVGFYEAKTHCFIEIKECMIAQKSINEVLKDFSMYAFLNGELVIRTNKNNEILMDLITNDEVKIFKEFPSKHKIVGILKNHKCIYGNPFFYERKNGVLYQISYNSFFQINNEISDLLFLYLRTVLKESQNVLDLYCGVGSLGLQIRNKNISVTGIEVVQNAVLNAILNAKLNHASNCSFHLGKVENLINKIPQNFDTVIVDPPRSGLDKKTIETILKMNFKKIVYVSCNPMTLIRDLKKLNSFYKMDSVKGFDMFPYTKHVECVCVLESRKAL